MSDFCKVYCAGSVKAPYDWITSVPIGINRLVYINGGEGGYIIDGVEIPFKKDCLYLFPGNAYFVKTYSSYANDDIRVDHGYVNFELIPPIISSEVFCIDPGEDDGVRAATQVFKALCLQCTEKKEFENIGSVDQRYLKSTVVFFVNKFIEKYNCEVITDKMIIKSLRLMQENLGQKQSVSDIARACYLSTDGFIRKFKKEVGETPYTYLKKLKIRTAQNMRVAGVKLNEIAEKCGYADSSALLHAIESIEKNDR